MENTVCMRVVNGAAYLAMSPTACRIDIGACSLLVKLAAFDELHLK